MYWPNLQLTKSESKTYALYSEPGKALRNVIYRVYAGELNLSTTITEDTENIQISRRARIFAMTASGDIHNTELEIFDSVGERYTMGFVPMCALLPGGAVDPRGMLLWQTARFASLFPVDPDHPTVGNNLGIGANACMTFAPHVFEPNIVLQSNQTLSLKGRAMVRPRTLNPITVGDPPVQERFTVSFCLHAWEFPVE